MDRGADRTVVVRVTDGSLWRVRRVEFAWVTNNCKLSSITTIFSHEMAEAFSDPEGDGIQVNPRGPVNWNEIGDVCNSTLAVDGVTVQSYWSTQDNACIVPYNQSVSYRVTCITKIHPHTDPYSAITRLGGTKDTDGSAWNLSVPEVMRLLDGGDRFYVHGADGSQSDLEAQSAVSPAASPRRARRNARSRGPSGSLPPGRRRLRPLRDRTPRNASAGIQRYSSDNYQRGRRGRLRPPVLLDQRCMIGVGKIVRDYDQASPAVLDREFVSSGTRA
jgi:hypothetical protein